MSVPIDIRGWEPLIIKHLQQALCVKIPPSKHIPNPPPVGIFRQSPGLLMVPLTYARLYGNSFLGQAKLDNWQLPPRISAGTIQFQSELRPQQIPPTQEAWRSLQTLGSVFLAMQPGFGKTSISLYLLSFLIDRGHVLILCAKSLVGQWSESVKKFLQIIPHVVNGNKPIPENVRILICTPGQVVKLDMRWRICQVLIVDECHTFATQTRINAVLSCYPRYIIGNSATILDNPAAFIKLAPIFGSNVIRAVDRHSFRVFMIKTGLDLPVPIDKDNKPDWHGLVTKLCKNRERNALLVEKVLQVLPGKKVLLLTWRNQAHAQKLAKLFSEQGVEAAIYTDSVTTCPDRPLTISTISKGGTGFDAKMAIGLHSEPFNVLFLATSIRSPSLLKQVIGRVYRAHYPAVYYFIDGDFISRSHLSAAIQVFREENAHIVW